MNRPTPTPASQRPPPNEPSESPYIGWIAGLVCSIAVLAIGTGLWMYFHGA
jgi:hypothetical protein